MTVEKHPQSIKIGIVQDSPVFLNLDESVRKASHLVEEAAGQDVELVVFPETWLPGYPVWLDYSPNAALWDHGPAKSLYRILVENSMVIPGPHVDQLLTIAQQTGTYIVVGVHEQYKGTLYNTILYVHKDGKSFQVHRKLIPTYTERLVWGRGDGSTVDVMKTEYGNFGALICWEHWMPLARAAMHAQNEVIHIAQWPMVKELHQIASRHYAFEGQCFVLAAGTILTKKEVLDGFDSLSLSNPSDRQAEEILNNIPGDDNDLILHGGSTVIGPDGKFVTYPLLDKKELITTVLDLQSISEGHLFMDSDGHYSRPDVFQLEVNTRPQVNVKFKHKSRS